MKGIGLTGEIVTNSSPSIANEFIARASRRGFGLTQMQLQKLVYMAHGWNLALNGRPLVSETPQAWEYGPVFPNLYDHTKFFGSQSINRPIRETDNDPTKFFLGGTKSSQRYRAELSPGEREVIERVWGRYGTLSGSMLSQLTHQRGTPWFNAYANRGKFAPISNTDVKHHYREIANQIGG